MQKEYKIMCPECRLETTIPLGGVRDLPSNFLINRLVDELILKRKVDGDEEVQCDKCEIDDPVVLYCPDCGDFLCHVCNELHKRDKRSHDHKIVPLTELRANKNTTLEIKAKIPPCKEHEYELKHYCETCEELVCLYCTMKGHSNHSHDTVKNMAGKHRNKLKEITAPVDDMIRGLAKAYDNIDKTRKNIKQHSNEIDKEIDQYYDELVQKVMKQKQQIKQQLHDKVSQKEKALTMQLEEIEFAQGEVFSMKELKDAVEKSSDQEALSAKKQIITRMTKLSEKYSKQNFQPVEAATIKFITTNQVQQFSELNFTPEESILRAHYQLPPPPPPISYFRHSPPQHSLCPSQYPKPVVEPTIEREKCRQCKEFFADDEYGGLCSACFKKLTIEESTQKPIQYQSQYKPASTRRSRLNFNQSPPTQNRSSLRASSIPQPYKIPNQCKAYGCGRNPAAFCEGYCAQCFNSGL